MGKGGSKQQGQLDSTIEQLFNVKDQREISIKLKAMLENQALTEENVRTLPLEATAVKSADNLKLALQICSYVSTG